MSSAQRVGSQAHELMQKIIHKNNNIRFACMQQNSRIFQKRFKDRLDPYTYKLMIAVDDIAKFHEKQKKEFPEQYKFNSKITFGKYEKWQATYFTKSGTKMFLYNDREENIRININLTYMALKDFKDELKYWNSLHAAALMQRPHEVLIQEDDEIPLLQNLNLKSCVAIQLYRMTVDHIMQLSEKDFYTQLLGLPYRNIPATDLMNRFDANKIPETQIEELRELYEPIFDEHFDGMVQLSPSQTLDSEFKNLTLISPNTRKNKNNLILMFIDKLKLNERLKVEPDDNLEESLNDLKDKQVLNKLHYGIRAAYYKRYRSYLMMRLTSGPFFISVYLFLKFSKFYIFYKLFGKVPFQGKKKQSSEQVQETV